MSASELETRQFHELMSSLCDDRISPADFLKLESLVEMHAELRKLYVKHWLLHGELLWSEGDGASFAAGRKGLVQVAEQNWAGDVREFFTRPTPLSMSVAAIVMCLIITAMALFVPPAYQHFAGNKEAPQSLRFVARLTDALQPTWSEGYVGVSTGAFLRQDQRLQLTGGMLELTFDTGTVVVLQGPCDFLLSGANAGELETGKLAATVPQKAIGFTVSTPTTTIVDLGTRFAVETGKSGTEVHVFEGEVEAAIRAGKGGSVRLIAGDAARFDAASSRVTQLPAQPDRFAEIPSVEFSQAVFHSVDEVRSPGRQVLAYNFGANAASSQVGEIQFAASTPPPGWQNGQAATFSQEDRGRLGGIFDGLVYCDASTGKISLPTQPGRKYVLQLFFDNDVNDSGDGQIVTINGRSFLPLSPRDPAARVVSVKFVARSSTTSLGLRVNGDRDLIINALSLHEVNEPIGTNSP